MALRLPRLVQGLGGLILANILWMGSAEIDSICFPKMVMQTPVLRESSLTRIQLFSNSSKILPTVSLCPKDKEKPVTPL